MTMPEHTCHAHGCTRRVAPKLFMCRDHWYWLRKPVRDAIWREYREGQEIDKRPSLRYMAVQQWAIGEGAFASAGPIADVTAPYVAAIVAPYLAQAEQFRQQAIEAGAGDPLVGLLASASGSIKRICRAAVGGAVGRPA